MSKTKIRPCDCKDVDTAQRMEEQGISMNEDSLMVEPNVVKLTISHTTIRIPMQRFKIFAEWYLREQELK